MSNTGATTMELATHAAMGTCQICDRHFKRGKDGCISRHGYKRPGDGQTYGTCYGSGHPAREVSILLKERHVEALKERVKANKDTVAAIDAGQINEVDAWFKERWSGNRKLVKIFRGDSRFSAAIDAERVRLVRENDLCVDEIHHHTKIILDWKPE